MKGQLVRALQQMFDLGIVSADNFSSKIVWIRNDDLLSEAFGDTQLRIEKYTDMGYCVARFKAEDITFKACIKVTDLQAHNRKAKGAA